MTLKRYEKILEDVWHSLTTSSPEVALKLLSTAALFALLWLLRKLVLQFIHRRSDARLLDSAHSVTAMLFYLILAFAVVRIWFDGFANFVTYLGLVAAALTIVCKELILNFVAMWVIAWRDLFSHGDRIQVGDYVGDVARKGPLFFTLVEVGNWVDADQSTGRTVRVPNSLVLTTPVANYSKGVGYIWNEISVVVNKDSDWERAQELLAVAVKDFYGEYGAPPSAEMHDDSEFVFYRKTTPKVYVRVADGGVKLNLRYLCRPKRRRDSENHIWTRILRDFKDNGLEIVY
ncbi:mechanosensitive ion channel family protein [Salidesulfovibrio onnuriiensis]|uniref:mechanosensitive ion channel family protein n=1 Tax=Salidesulfovibrio onnuriiensis TaxID=2583823 RepID=UPI0011C94B82|nr:mechanosensitive ion channel domain-containing protein [Salidesulfovibrio onnuriiensis]